MTNQWLYHKLEPVTRKRQPLLIGLKLGDAKIKQIRWIVFKSLRVYLHNSIYDPTLVTRINVHH